MRTLTILIAITIGCGDDSMSAPPDGMADARIDAPHADATQGGIGCTADLFTAAAVANQGPGLDEGTLHITGSTATIPPCTFVAGAGYLCIGQFGQGSTVNVAPGAQGTATVTVSGANFTTADAGRYLDIRGDATNTSNNG